jgi:hypothetical protein
MSLQEILRLLINSLSIDIKQLEIIKKSLLAKARKHEEPEWIDQRFLKKAYDASLRLMIIRLRDGQDQAPCKNLFDLVIYAPSENNTEELHRWIKENSLMKDTSPANRTGGASSLIQKSIKTKIELEKLKKIASYVKFHHDNDLDPKRVKKLARYASNLPDL